MDLLFATGNLAGDIAGGAFGAGVLLLLLAVSLVIVALFVGGDNDSSAKVSLTMLGGGAVSGALSVVAIVLVAPIALIASFSYTPPIVPVPASTVILTESDGVDRERFQIVCDSREGEVELVGTREGEVFTASAYRLRVERGDISQAAQFSIGLRWENKGWGSRFGGQPSWMENVVSGDKGIRADGTWQAGYLDRPIILSKNGEYVLRVGLGSNPCPHLIAIS